jgi:hypothetical protein
MTAPVLAGVTQAPPHRDAARLAPEHRATAAAAVVLVAMVMAAAAWDPTGLLGPVGGRGLPLMGSGDVYRWAPFVIGLPIMVTGTAVPVFVIAGRRVAARWLFASTWLALVGAAAWATAVTGFVSALPMTGSHLSLWTAAAFEVQTSGFAAAKFLLFGPLVAAAAAVAYRAGPRALYRPKPAGALSLPVSVGVMVAVVSLAALGPAAHWWRGGPIGYAFAGFAAAPSAASGVPGYFAGVAVFAAAFAGAAGIAHRRLGGLTAVTVLLAAVAAGLGLGLVDAIGVAVADAGRDSWWIASTLMSVAAATGYGAMIGLAGTIVAVGADRWLRSRAQLLLAARFALVLVAVAPVIGAPGVPEAPSHAAVPASGGMERLRVVPAARAGEPATIGDATGRQVILRGVNVNQLIDYYLRDPAIAATQPLTDGDFAQMAAMGFNVVRLGMSWSLLEPQRGNFDSGYLARVRSAVAMAKTHGLYTVLDMHQDAWGNALARPSEKCGGGMMPTTGWDGAPAWATITDGAAHCQFLARDLAPAVASAFGNFYADRDGIQSELVRAWDFVVRAFANEPAIAGYDLLNEPGVGAEPPTSSALLLGRYYDAAIAAIRTAERAAGGYAHLAFFQPSVLWSGMAFDVTPPPGFTGDRQIVFAPHPYSESITMDQSFGMTIASIERNLAISARAAASYGAALWPGEWGWFGDPSVDGAKVRRFAAAQDRLGIGGAFWVWRQGCGSPETLVDAVTSGNLVQEDCRTGASSPPPEAFAQPLARAYPRAFPGRLDSLRPGGSFRATAPPDAANCAVDAWFPGDAQPRLTTTGIDGLAYQQVSGGWRVTGCAHGAYAITAHAP